MKEPKLLATLAREAIAADKNLVQATVQAMRDNGSLPESIEGEPAAYTWIYPAHARSAELWSVHPPHAGDVVQIAPDAGVHPSLRGLLAVVEERTGWGVKAEVLAVGGAYPVRLQWSDFEIVGHARWDLEGKPC